MKPFAKAIILTACIAFLLSIYSLPLPAAELQLKYSTYLGGYYNDRCEGIAVSGGSAYVTGWIKTDDFPTVNPYQSSSGGGTDAYVTRFSSSGSSLIYATYIGGSGYDCGGGIAVFGGLAYVTGYTNSINFPTVNPYQGEGGGDYDVYVACLSSSGSSLIYSTYLGGEGDDGYGQWWFRGKVNIAVSNDLVCVSGWTESTDFPTVNPYQATLGGGGDAFITCFSSTGSSLIFSSYLGGSEEDHCGGIAISDETAYLVGQTNSNDFPILNPYQASYSGNSDAFVASISFTGSFLLYSTYLGGSGLDSGNGIAISGGAAYVTGQTRSSDFPTTNPYQESFFGVGDAFVTKFSSGGSSLLYSTFLGGAALDYGIGIGVSDGSIYVAGETWSIDFPTVDPYQASHMIYNDIFVTRFSSSGSLLDYSTYLGGVGEDYGNSLAVEGNSAYVVGWTGSGDFPVRNPYQRTMEGYYDGFISKLAWGPTPTPTTPTPTSTPTPTPPCSIKVHSPNGGEDWTMGQVEAVSWNDCNLGGYASIYLYRGTTRVGTIASWTPNDGYYSRYIPVHPSAAGCTYRVLVQHQSGEWDISDDYFCISAGQPTPVPTPTPSCTFRVISPNGGETWAMGQGTTITWEDCNLGGSVYINAYRAGVLVRSFRAPNTGTFTIPQLPVIPAAAGCNFRIEVWYSYAVNDRSDGDFCILIPSEVLGDV